MYLQISPIVECWGVRLGLVGVVVGGAITSLSFANAFGNAALAQVVPDNTLGGENSVVTSTDSVDAISGGATRGGNLFHSFQQFSVPTNGAAFFNNATNIQNILTRVTGSSVSEIDGLIQANGAANLFLLNPNGIVFGQNARLNIGGSFIATTASSINFADGTQFSATPGAGAPLLTVSVPLGLQFGSSPREIVNRSQATGSNNFIVGLQVQLGKTLGLIGGNVSLEGGSLTAAGGRIELGAVAAPGVIGISPDSSGFRFSFPTDLALGDISLLNDSIVDVRAGGGGDIAVNSSNLSILDGGILIAGIDENQGVVGAVAGDIDVNAELIGIVGQSPQGFYSGLFNYVGNGGTGKGGNINLKARSLFLGNAGVISTSVFGIGNAGDVNIALDDRLSLDNNSIIFSQVGETGIGNGGSISISARSLSLTNAAQLVTSTFGRGNAGNININTSDATFLQGGDSNGFSSGIFTNVEDTGIGNSGNVSIRTDSLFLRDNGIISTSTAGIGNAGNVTIDARDGVSLDRSGVFSRMRETGIVLQLYLSR